MHLPESVSISKLRPGLHRLPHLYGALLLLQVAFVWWLPWFPSQDGPCHLYNLAILKDLRSGGAFWGSIFADAWTFSPNLGFSLIVYPLLSVMSPWQAEKVFVSLYLLAMGGAMPLLLSALALPAMPWSFLVFPAAWSLGLAMGFYSYNITIPLVMAAIAATWTMRRRSFPFVTLLVSACSALLYCCHLLGFLWYLAFVAIWNICEDRSTPLRRLGHTAAMLAPSGLLLLRYLQESSRSLPIGKTAFRERLPALAIDLVTAGSYSLHWSQVITGGLLVILLYALLRHGRHPVAGDRRFAVFAGYAGCLLILYLTAPSALGGGSDFNQRIPQMILIALIPMVAIRQTITPRICAVVIGCVVLWLCVTAWCYRDSSRLVSDYLAGLAETYTPGTAVMAYTGSREPRSRVQVLRHAVSYYALRHRLINVNNYQLIFPLFPIKYLPGITTKVPFPDRANYEPDGIDLRRYPLIRYVITWRQNSRPDRVGLQFRRRYEKGHLTIWERW
jgi:hypothetical protein